MRSSLYLFLILILSDACIDRLRFEVGDLNQGVLVVEGSITDQPGPYTVKLLTSSNVDEILNFTAPYTVKSVRIVDDLDHSATLTDEGEGIYTTDVNEIRGEVGRKYSLQIELLDGSIVESTPDEMRPVGGIDSLYYKYEALDVRNGPPQYGFRVFVDATDVQGEDNYVRWRYEGTYKVLTYPELNKPPNCRLPPGQPKPLPCSGYIYSGGILKRIGECTCCYCWVSDAETKPHLNDDQVVTNGEFKQIELGFVPITPWTFMDNKYMIKVEQMSLSREAYEFWSLIRDQKEGLTSLFQPAFGKIRTNLISHNPNHRVTGIFYASSVVKQVKFIKGSESPLPIPQQDIQPPESNCALWYSCDGIFPNASRTPPPEWK